MREEVALILAEDTRTSKRLLDHYNITTPLRSHHAHNEHGTLTGILAQLKSGQHIAVISDAGTPGISDPGFLLLRECIREGIKIECLPGATALIPAVVNSGLPCDSFYYEGFLPHKKGRQTRLKYLCTLDCTFILYESPHRLLKCLKELAEFCGADRQAAVCRELTKFHEEIARGTLQELHAHFSAKEVKGEIVITVGGAPNTKREKSNRYSNDEDDEE